MIFDEIVANGVESSDDTAWLHLLLNQLCYLPYVKDSDFLTTKLLDLLEIATYPAQSEILNSIPKVIPDAKHRDVAKELCMFF